MGGKVANAPVIGSLTLPVLDQRTTINKQREPITSEHREPYSEHRELVTGSASDPIPGSVSDPIPPSIPTTFCPAPRSDLLLEARRLLHTLRPAPVAIPSNPRERSWAD